MVDGLVKNSRAFFKIILFSFVIFIYLFSASVLYLLSFQDHLRRQRLIKNTQFFCKLLIKAYNIELICKNPIESTEVSLVIGNHMGFIDVVCMQSIQPSVFVTSTEMKNTPVLGQIAVLAGCCFVNRNNRMNIDNELKDLILVLKDGFRVGLYPEARASNGEQVLPFKKTLLMSAGLAAVPIRPYVFNYKKVNDRPVRFTDRDSLCWYDDNGFLSAIWKSIQIKNLVCEIEFLPLVFVSPEEDRTFISEKIHDQIAEKFIPFQLEM